MSDRYEPKEHKYITCEWCGCEIYYDKDCHDEAYEVGVDIVCERCFSEYTIDCKSLADYYFEDLC